MKNSEKSVAQAIGVAPCNPERPMASGAKWANQNTSLIEPDDVASDQQNILQGRASVGEKAPNVFRGNA